MKRKMPGWVKDAIFYQLYPQSFFDSNKDGIGDIPGIMEKLDYLHELGVNTIWINPCFVSPFRDGGYDIADFYKIAPRYGTNHDLKKLIRAAGEKGMRVCLDLVPAHTSINHPWFKASCQAQKNKYTNYYVWTDSIWDNGRSDTPNSITTINGYAPRDGNFMNSFFYFQPALNYGFANPEPNKPWQLPVNHPDVLAVKNELKKIIRFWLAMGISGYRVDMASTMIKGDVDFKATRAFWGDIRALLEKEYPDAVLIAEWGDPQTAVACGFHVDFFLHFGTCVDAYLSLCRKGTLSFFHPEGKGDIRQFLDVFEKQLRQINGVGYISLPTGNHDMERCLPGIPAKNLELLFAFMFTMPVLPCIYYGDEIGLPFRTGLESKEGGFGRTGSRTPMQWERGNNMGFSKGRRADLYLPVDEKKGSPCVRDQEKKEGSLVNRVKWLAHLRQEHPCLNALGEFIPVFAKRKKYPLVYLRADRNEKILVAINPSGTSIILTPRLAMLAGVSPMYESPGCKGELHNGRLRLTLPGQSYGIYRI